MSVNDCTVQLYDVTCSCTVQSCGCTAQLYGVYDSVVRCVVRLHDIVLIHDLQICKADVAANLFPSQR